MSEQVNKAKQLIKPKQSFNSKTINHINQYSLIKQVTSFVLSIGIVNSFYTSFVLPLYNFINNNILSISPIYNILSYVDNLYYTLLVTFDKYFLEIPLETLNSIGKTYISPLDDKLIAVNNKYLKPIENKSTKEFYNIVYTVQEILINLKNFTFDKSSEIQKTIVDTYNQELQSNSNESSNVIGKNLTASYNTASKTITKLNDDYITPLKLQTQDYVDQFTTQTKQRADEFINDAKSKVAPKINEIKESVPAAVSASA
ncbi:hypothetical protein Cantr_08807 [Candida viswanathii]|uniref:Uncharacterized protein n=1 Tax=Candida viswanathii TaxID=5486 RepID=A0A367Y9I9_9ASCO|nr:hypothetical protein Cantr_08807 [Candida viswanathii]